MLRYLSLIVLLTLFSSPLFAQQRLSGRILENKTRITLNGVRIVNLRNKISAMSDSEGKFSISASVNDMLTFSIYGYRTDTIVVINLASREVFMDPVGQMLKDVNVSQSQLKIPGIAPGGTPDFHNQTTVYQRDANGNYKGGVAFRIFNNSGEKKRQEDAEKAKTEAKRLEIDKKFSPKGLAEYLPLKDTEFEGFKMYYIPSVSTYSSPRFNLLIYLDSCYKEFQKLSPEKRVIQPLGKPADKQ